MINFNEVVLSNCIVHSVGNRVKDEGLILSDESLMLTDDLKSNLNQYFLKQFKVVNETYHFRHDIDLKMNEVFVSVDNIFENDNFIKNSQNIAKHIFKQTRHPAILSGELFISLFEDVVFDNTVCKAVGIFKSEKRDVFFKTHKAERKIDLLMDAGISPNRLDKGCLILNENYHQGFTVLTYEQGNADTAYWRDDFLSIEYSLDKYGQTNEFINLIKEYSSNHIKENYGKQEQVNFINHALNYVGKSSQLDVEVFEKEVLGNEVDRKEFTNFRKNYLDERDIELPNTFDIAPNIVSSQKRKVKNEIKLDTNISIKLEGNLSYAQRYIEQGFDRDRKMNYYKVYYNTES